MLRLTPISHEMTVRSIAVITVGGVVGATPAGAT
jgi:hypothetical protein